MRAIHRDVEAHGFSRAKKESMESGFSRCGQLCRARILAMSRGHSG